MSKQFKMKWTWFLSISVLFLVSCTKDPIKELTAEESRIYITNYDTTTSFANYSSFRLADSVAIIVNNQLQSRERTAGDAQIINAVANALQQRGYTRANQNADLGITISSITNTQTQLVNYTDYGGYYGSYWDPFYWGYSNYSYYFPTYYGIYETNETALAVDIVDLKNASSNNQIRVIWSGLIRGAGIFSGRDTESQINALFNQSAYLKR